MGWSVTWRPGYTGHTTLPVSVWEPKRRTTDIPLVFVPGLGAGADDVYTQLEWLRVVDAGVVGIAANLSTNGDGWGNLTERAALEALIAWAGTNYGTRTDQVGFFGGSMGGFTINTFVAAHPTVARVVAMEIPAVDLQAVHDRNILGTGASIEGAFGGLAGYLAALPVFNPARHPGTFAPAAGVTKIWSAFNDNIAPYNEALAWAHGAGITEFVNVGNIGHTGGTDANYWPDVVDWLIPRLREPATQGGLTVNGNVTVQGTVRRL